jgi:hypothetical protein
MTEERDQLPRKFNKVELAQIEEVKTFMRPSFDVRSWNHLRKQAQEIWTEKIISAVDGLRKWIVTYDKPTKVCTCEGVKL